MDSKKDKKVIALVENGKLQELYEEDENQKRIEGNIYVGKVKDVLPGMQAAFVDIGERKNTFIHIKDILPKVSNITGNKNENLENYNIKDYIKKDDKILVQVKKDSISTKGARVTTHMHITGRFVVVLPENEFITVSQKIEKEKERQRLIDITKEAIGNKKVGIIIRTAAEGKEKELIIKDIENSIKKLENIIKQSKEIKEVPKVILKSDTILEKILLDLMDNKLERIIVNNKNIMQLIEAKIKENYDNSKVKIELKEGNILNTYDIDDQIEKMQNRKIWLRCGGFITIDKTEALTAIDVNSGKFTGKENLEQTVLKVNKEASVEIAKQLRLRDIGGIIIIDYIDMNEQKSKEEVIETLKENLKQDRAKTQIMEFTKLNLLEMTRKHMFSND